MFTRSRRILALFLPLLLAGGCTSPSQKSSEAGQGGKPGVLRYALSAEPTTLDPALVTDGVTIDVLQNLYDGLVGWDEKNRIVPLVAATLPKVSPDGKIYTFTLRKGVRFHNGRAVTAEDVRYSLTRALERGLNSSVALDYLNDIQGANEFNAGKIPSLTGVKVIDPATVQITLTAPRAYFLGKLTYLTAAIVPKEEVERGDKSPGGVHTITEKNSVGCGPFKLKTYQRQSKLVLEANPDYWNGSPRIQTIERPIVLDPKTVRNLFDAGELDFITLEKGDYETVKADPNYEDKIRLNDRASTFYFGLSQKAYPPFKDRRVRQAIAHAIDRKSIVKNVLLDVNLPAEGVIPRGIFSYDPTFKGLAFDPAKSRQLLTAAGYPNGKGLPPLAIYIAEQSPDLHKVAEVLKEQLAAIGIPTTITEMEWGAYLKAQRAFQQPAFYQRWGADYLDPQNFLSLLLTSTGNGNYTGYSNPEYDRLCAQADRENDQAKRIALYRKAERIVVDDAPWVPICYLRDLELRQPWVQGKRDGLLGPLPHTTTEIR